MLESERTKLFDPKREYVNIGISDGGVVYSITPIFWESSAAAFSMKTPDVYIAPEDLSDPEIMSRIRSLTVHGLYIYTPLRDYSFIAELTELWDLHIERAENIKNLDFLAEMHELSMLFIHNVDLPDMDVIFRVKKADKGIVGAFRYICLYDCRIGRTPDFSDPKLHFTEFLVWSKPENAQRDRDTWSETVAYTKKYFIIENKA